MAVAIVKSFFAASQKLSNEERGRVFTFIGKFQENPALPGQSLERVKQAKSDNIWAARVTDDIRAIAVKDGGDWALVHVDHHDEAYKWTENRSIERHGGTGDLQIVELPTKVIKAESSIKDPGLYDRFDEDYLFSLGVPKVWLPTIRQIRDDVEMMEVLEKLPEDVAERLYDLASGKLVTPPTPVKSISEAASDDDRIRNLYLVRSQDELRPLLDAPMSQWIAFLHPTQRKLAYGSFNGPVKITGSAGTGKTVVAMHRARFLAGQGKKVLLTSYVNNLCHNLRRNLQLFCTAEELDRITVSTLHHQALMLLKESGHSFEPIGDEDLQNMLRSLTGKDCPLDAETLFAEWRDVIQAQGLTTWEQYRSSSRVGRGRPLTVKDRRAIWDVIERFHETLDRRGKCSFTGLCWRVIESINKGMIVSPFDAVIVDEVQDLGLPELRLLSTLAGQGADRLMIAGDGGQRIYAARQSLKSLGIDVRGRSHVLRLNYRTTEQIRRFADAVLGDEADDLEGGKEIRKGTRSLLSGPEPVLKAFDSRPAQCDFVAEEISRLLEFGRTPDEIAIFARQAYLLDMIETRLRRVSIPFYRMTKEDFPEEPMVSLGSMYRAKGLEFKYVFVIDASEDQLPYGKILAKKTDEQSRQDFIEQDRQLLYVSLTRARDCVFVTWAGNRSQFLDVIDSK